MRDFRHVIVGLLALVVSTLLLAQTNTAKDLPARLSWAYLWDESAHSQPPDPQPMQIPGSTMKFSMQQARNMFSTVDWFPEAHPVMPAVVEFGRKPDLRACGGCHRVEGTAGADSASIAGLPAAYIVQQMADFKSGARRSALQSRPPENLMTLAAQVATDEEIQAAAKYFSELKPRQVVRVIESDTAPTTTIVRYFYARQGEGQEPLGPRIVEVPDDFDQYELHNPRATFTAYVPKGSLTKGRALVESKATPTMACAVCHGADLRGVGVIPSIAGRSPSYLARQLYAFKIGTRNGTNAALMKPVAERFSEDDIVSVVAYLASLAP